MFQLQLFFFLLHCDEWDRVVALPRHKFVTGATLLQLAGKWWGIKSENGGKHSKLTIENKIIWLQKLFQLKTRKIRYFPQANNYFR